MKLVCEYCNHTFITHVSKHYLTEVRCPVCKDSHFKIVPEKENKNIFGYEVKDE